MLFQMDAHIVALTFDASNSLPQQFCVQFDHL